MKYLMIRNHGEAPIQSFTVLGLSTARGNSDAIGQFGSGSKHGVLTLMRAGVDASIYIGANLLRFFKKEVMMGERAYEEVWYEFMGESHRTGMCLEFGALDWNEIRMAIREFICNALDQGEPILECVNLVDSPEPREAETRIFIPMENADVRKSWEEIGTHFLHVDGLEKTPIFESQSTTETRFYRRGVFVKALHTKHAPLFSYNFHDGKIDESRNMDGSAMGNVAAKLLLKEPDKLTSIFSSFLTGSCWEHEIGSSVYISTNCTSQKEGICNAWKEAHGDATFFVGSVIPPALEKKKINFVSVPHGWGNALRYSGVVDAASLLTSLDKHDAEEVEATPTAMETFKRAWGWLEAVRLTEGKPFPKVKCFSAPMSQGCERIGFYRNGTVFLNLDYDTNEQAALEELAHYITGAEDETRDFQDFAFKAATRLAKAR